jgi:hypothetical protein
MCPFDFLQLLFSKVSILFNNSIAYYIVLEIYNWIVYTDALAIKLENTENIERAIKLENTENTERAIKLENTENTERAIKLENTE